MGDEGVPQSYWKALFEFASRAGADDPVNQGTVEPKVLTNSDRKWLEEAMQDLVKDTDPVRKMKGWLKELAGMDLFSPTETELERGEEILMELVDLIDNLDMAKVFHQIGGFRILRPLLISSSPGFRAAGANLIGELAQNHEYIQKALQENKTLPLLLETLDHDGNSRVRLKALFAISSEVIAGFVRSDDPTVLPEFTSLKGLDVVVRSLQAEERNPRFVTKALFFLSQLAKADAGGKKSMLEMGVPLVACQCLESCEAADPVCERSLELLAVLTEDNPTALTPCLEPNVNLKGRLDFLRKEALNENDDESLKECLDYIGLLMKRIESAAVSEPAER